MLYWCIAKWSFILIFMCFFPSGSPEPGSAAYRAGIKFYKCGACPECLRDRANSWVLRAYYESQDHVNNCMVCLTYDSYIRDEFGKIIGERVSDLSVCKRDVQLFIKRLRKWYSSFSDERIKYLICAEYGSRTHRPHYHALLFGVRFPDCVPYKKSKRGNLIYTSHILERLWSHGICTVDSLNITSACARYCTKYVAKSRSDDTFMLASQSVGLQGLLRDFNGYSYFVEGREYPIPRRVWNDIIMRDYACVCRKFPDGELVQLDYRYINRENWFMFETGRRARSLYREFRDSDERYQSYLRYWQRKGEMYEKLKPSVPERIMLLDDSKYHNYKVASLKCFAKRKLGIPSISPGSGCRSEYAYYLERVLGVPAFRVLVSESEVTCPLPPCLNRASDTKFVDRKRLHRKILNKLRFEGVYPLKPKVFLHYPLAYNPFDSV